MRADDAAELAELAEPLRSRLAALLSRAGGAVTIESGRRDIQEQVDLRRANCGPSWWDIWRKPATQCSPTTAIPGTSPHETGEAADLGGDLGLAARLARSLGLHFPVRGENWHVEANPSVTQVAGLAGFIPGATLDIPDPFGIGDAATDAVAGVLGELVDPLVEGLARVALVGVLIAGGVGLVVLGGIRGVHSVERRVIADKTTGGT